MQKSNRRHFKSMLRDECGNVAMMFGLMAIPFVAIMGAAVDYSRTESFRTKLQYSADAAALAAARAHDQSDEDRRTLAIARFKANFSPNDPSLAPEPTVMINGAAVTVSATSTVDTPILSIFNPSKSEAFVSASSDAAYETNGHKLEVAMMVDLTGSMGQTRNGETKIQSLKTASIDLMNILLPDNGANDGLVKVAIAPFADYVNAGQYAAAATGLASTGSYDNLNNLASTKNGSFTGTYASGTIGNASGSQAGSTSPTSGSWAASSGTTTSGGDTYASGHCDVPTETTSTTTGGGQVSFQSLGNNNSNWPVGKKLEVEGMSFPPNVVAWASYGSKIKEITKYKNNAWKAETSQDWGWWVKVPTSTAGLTWRTDGTNKIGLEVELEGNNTTWPAGLELATAANPIRKIEKWKWGAWKYADGAAKTSGRFILIPDSWIAAGTTTSTTTTKPACTTTAQTTGQLISCVTEREGNQAYTDAAPSMSVVGAYNHGVTSKKNYSSDGKCNVAGRELPSVIPLTGDRATLTSFFTNAKVGGATPGHLGTAWAWYMLSPAWNSVFGTSAAAYDADDTTKAVILLTDGEYNIHYASAAARTQALELCTNMKAQGIKVYTIGFGFSTTSTATDNTTEGRAKDLMQQCASPAVGGGSNNYYFPYDGTALRQTFSDIGSSLISTSEIDNIRVTQ